MQTGLAGWKAHAFPGACPPFPGGSLNPTLKESHQEGSGRGTVEGKGCGGAGEDQRSDQSGSHFEYWEG
eukprot:1015618-Amorphochlora_amoeboformis.AAC.1